VNEKGRGVTHFDRRLAEIAPRAPPNDDFVAHLQLAIPGQSSGNAANRKARDFFYSPAYYIAKQDFYAFIQSNGFARFNLFHPCGDFYQGKDLWPDYTWPFQPHGRGDGSDGKADNRQCLATTKSAAVNQDLQNVSVRGQAFLDWMGAILPRE
jgi:hypothetical protein